MNIFDENIYYEIIKDISIYNIVVCYYIYNIILWLICSIAVCDNEVKVLCELCITISAPHWIPSNI